MTNQDKIKEIREALDKITPGEWTASRTFSPAWAVHLGDRKLVLLGRAGLTGSMAGEIRGDLNESDATFIANSPEWVRFLLSEIERLQQERNKLIEGLRWYGDEYHYILEGGYVIYDPTSEMQEDRGQLARNILKEIGVTME